MRFPFFPRDFRGSVGRKTACFFGGFSLPFSRRQGKEGQGSALQIAFRPCPKIRALKMAMPTATDPTCHVLVTLKGQGQNVDWKIAAEASFSAYLFAFLNGKKKQTLAIIRPKRDKGRDKKDDQIWSSFFFGRKVHFSPVSSNFLPKR